MVRAEKGMRMLKQPILVVVLVLGSWPSSAWSQTTQPAEAVVVAPAATQPTTAPAQGQTLAPGTTVIVTTPSGPQQPQTLTQVLAQTRLGKLAQGEQVSLDDLRNPAFWIDTVKDLVVALVGFVPRRTKKHGRDAHATKGGSRK